LEVVVPTSGLPTVVDHAFPVAATESGMLSLAVSSLPAFKLRAEDGALFRSFPEVALTASV